MIQFEKIPQAPGYKMICAGCIAAQADRTNDFLSGRIKRQAAAKTIYSADFLPHKGIVASTEIGRGALVSGLNVNGIAFLKAEQTLSGLDCRKEIRRGERQAAR